MNANLCRNRTFRTLACTCLLIGFEFLAISATVVGQTQEHPNILFIFLDDLGWRDCSYMGSDFYETPHLDRLASAGMVFTNAYAAAANCAPSRACLLSGQYTPRHAIYNVGTGLRGNPKFSKLKHVPGTDTLRDDIQTWAHCIRDAGYKTATIGKWHLSQDPLPYGFDVNIGGSHSGSPPKGYFPPHPGAPGLQDAAEDEYLTDRLTDEALTFIQENQTQPWLLYLTHFAVHSPRQSREDLLEKYRQKPAGELHDSNVMAGMIHSVDEGIGRILAQLEELDLADKTAIVFSSDNGGDGTATSMHPLKGYKGTFYEGGIREPFFVTWPGKVRPGTRSETPIINLDLFPTLCSIAGADLPADQILDGEDLVPLLTGKGTLKDRALFWHFPAYLQGYSRIDQQRDPIFRTRPCGIIRRGKWKLHEYFEDGGLELYDLSQDIGETHNLAESRPKRVEALHHELMQWREQVSAPVPSEPNPQYDALAETQERERLVAKQESGKRKKGEVRSLKRRKKPGSRD